MCVDSAEQPVRVQSSERSKIGSAQSGSASQPICIEEDGHSAPRPPLKQTTLSDFFAKRS